MIFKSLKITIFNECGLINVEIIKKKLFNLIYKPIVLLDKNILKIAWSSFLKNKKSIIVFVTKFILKQKIIGYIFQRKTFVLWIYKVDSIWFLLN